MRVLGKLRCEDGSKWGDFERYIALDVQQAEVKVFSYSYSDCDSDCFVKVISAFKCYYIIPEDAEALTPEQANNLVHNIALCQCVDLDKYNMVVRFVEEEGVAIHNGEGLLSSVDPLVVEINEDD